jgi:hypothetical protein
MLVPDQLAPSAYRTSYFRRGIGILVGGSPVLLLGASGVRAVTTGRHPSAAALAMLLVGIAIAAMNFYLSFIRPRLFYRAHGSLDAYKFVSGVPMLGTLVVVIGTVLGFGTLLCTVLGLFAVVLDTGGSVWVLVATWRDVSLWDVAQRTSE